MRRVATPLRSPSNRRVQCVGKEPRVRPGLTDEEVPSEEDRVYVLAHRNDIDFNLATIPLDFVPDFQPTDFDKQKMQKLFDFAYDAAKEGYEWLKAPPFLDPDELFESK